MQYLIELYYTVQGFVSMCLVKKSNPRETAVINNFLSLFND